ncbi:ribbon-helix-helix protein, CopG family [Parvibaculum sp.]|uniref:ribbon-helix-helix protein, CopG family n=1 Tax=Parvibaculum sp. TaxID=2024848 RepID=UPI0034A0439F
MSSLKEEAPETGDSEERRGRRGHRHGRRHKRHGGEERDTTRVQLEMPPQAMERLQQLKDKTEAASYAEVIRNALRLYEALIDEAERGAEFQVKGPDGMAVPYRIFL